MRHSRGVDLKSVLDWRRSLTAFAAATLVLVVVCSIGLALDGRVLFGASIWSRPLKFAVSFTLYATTLAWASSLLPSARPVLRRVGWLAGAVIATLSTAEWALLLTQVLRGRMSQFNYATPLDGFLPITGWSTTGGDLRVPHFVGMQAMQVLPLVAILLSLLASSVQVLRDEQVRIRLVQLTATGYAGLVGLVTWQALRGQSLIRPDALTLSCFTALLATTSAGVLEVLGAGQWRARAN